MESDLFNGSLPFPVNFTTLAIGLALVLAVIAAVRGVIGMFVGLACLLAGAFVGYSSHSMLPGWLSQIDDNPSPRFVFFVAIGIGFSAYVMLRLLAGAILLSPLRRAGGKRLIGGPIGAALSLVPATGLVFVVGVTLRMAGSLFSVEHTDAGVAIEDGQSVAERPFWARWNEAMDRDYLGALVAKLDPLAASARGAITNLLVALKDNAAGGKLAEDPAAAGVLRSDSLRDMANDPEIRQLVERGDFIALFDHPKMKQVASDPEIAKLLKGFQVEKAVDSSLYAVEDSGELRRRERRLRLFGPRS
jgi:hypothetical protein